MFNRKLYEELQKSQPDGYDGERNSNEPRKPLQSERNHIFFFNIYKSIFIMSLLCVRKKCEKLF